MTVKFMWNNAVDNERSENADSLIYFTVLDNRTYGAVSLEEAKAIRDKLDDLIQKREEYLESIKPPKNSELIAKMTPGTVFIHSTSEKIVYLRTPQGVTDSNGYRFEPEDFTSFNGFNTAIGVIN